MSFSSSFHVATSTLASALRLGAGQPSEHPCSTLPAQPLQLYDFEGCPFCRKAREALSNLRLTAEVYPCPKQGSRYRPQVQDRGGKAQFPYLVDPGAGVEMYESSAIISYLYKQYGERPIPWQLRTDALTLFGSLGSLVRLTAGTFTRPSRSPKQLLELHGSEASPSTRLVRERLCELEIAYRSIICHTPNFEPELCDPNTDQTIRGWENATRYLNSTYAI